MSHKTETSCREDDSNMICNISIANLSGIKTGFCAACSACSQRSPTDLDEHGQAVVGVAGCVQVVLVLLGDVRHQHVHQSLHRVVVGGGEALVSGELGNTKEKWLGAGSKRGSGDRTTEAN